MSATLVSNNVTLKVSGVAQNSRTTSGNLFMPSANSYVSFSASFTTSIGGTFAITAGGFAIWRGTVAAGAVASTGLLVAGPAATVAVAGLDAGGVSDSCHAAGVEIINSP